MICGLLCGILLILLSLLVGLNALVGLLDVEGGCLLGERVAFVFGCGLFCVCLLWWFSFVLLWVGFVVVLC